ACQKLVWAGNEDTGSWPPGGVGEWRFLFDGKTTQGWRGFGRKDFPRVGWVVEDGCLKHRARGGGGDIITEETFDEFELEFEWKLSQGSNSGVKYFVVEERREPIGHEYQVIDDPAYGFDKPAHKHQTASFYDVLAPTVYVHPRPPGEFNSSRIVVRGTHVEHWLNGVKVLEYELGSPEVMAAVKKSKFVNVRGFGTKMKGHILLQDHGGEVWFRNIRIRTPNKNTEGR
ncbi:MAG: DUF1080 domain-containing protein, partial [Kiritimatiellae bacterium]|nr:DUF1080 domain-containing protein [Kiritimatiellia bacterium]